MSGASTRHFLFLQGPHGPFFAGLSKRLRRAGARTSRIGFNFGDQVFWRQQDTYHAYHGGHSDWPGWLTEFVERNGVTDIVYYGASRPIHKTAHDVATRLGVKLHVFEEGYLRPYWVSYERGGANATSPMRALTIEDMRQALDHGSAPLHRAPDRWGDMRAHVLWGATYHAILLAGRGKYPGFKPHRTPEPQGEFWLYLKHLLTMPLRRMQRWMATIAIRLQTHPYHVVLLQLAHDANFLDNGRFNSQSDFLHSVFDGFARGAPAHHRLVIKAHPLEDGREPLAPLVKSLTGEFGLHGRVCLLTGGKLARLLDGAESAVTVNSTAAEQVLWRGLPLKSFGPAAYHRPEFASSQSLDKFFASPSLPNTEAYEIYRRFLLATSQTPGGFYGLRNRRKLYRKLPDLMLRAKDPYETVLNRPAAGPQHLKVVS